MKSKNKKEKGIALIITIMLSAIMMTTVFVASREMLDEAKNSTRIDNSLIAYYAAEAGIEDALLQYRFDKKAELRSDGTIGANPEKCVNLDNEKKNINDCSSSWIPKNGMYTDNAFADRFYKVKMWYKVDSLNDPTILNKDNVLEISLPDTNSNVDFKWSDINVPLLGGNRMRTEITTYSATDGLIIDKQFLDSKTDQTSFTSSGPSKIIRIKPWYVKNDASGEIVQGDLPSDGTIPSIKITDATGLKGMSGTNFGGPFTNIESIGYYGGVQRKIVANIDRTSGQVLSIMDFVIYSGSDLIK